MATSFFATLGRMKAEGLCGTDVASSCSPNLPPSLVAQILCYNVCDLKDIARLRLISKAVGQLAVTMLPMMGNRINLLPPPMKGEDFVEKMVHLDGFKDTNVIVGERWLLEDELSRKGDTKSDQSCNSSDNLIHPFEGATVTQILFLSKPTPLSASHREKSERILQGSRRSKRRFPATGAGIEDEHFLRRRNLLQGLYYARDLEILQALYEQARSDELLDPVYKKNSTRGGSSSSASTCAPRLSKVGAAPTGTRTSTTNFPRCYTYPVLLSLDLNQDARCVERCGDGWVDLAISPDIQSNFMQQDRRPFLVAFHDSNTCYQGVVVSPTAAHGRYAAQDASGTDMVVDATSTTAGNRRLRVVVAMNLLGNANAVGNYRRTKVECIDDMALSSTTKRYQNLPARDGVALVDGPVVDVVRWGLNSSLEKLARKVQNEKGTLLELLDPELFCYVAGLTLLRERVPQESNPTSLLRESMVDSAAYRLKAAAATFANRNDDDVRLTVFWGREYDDTAYQYLPSTFAISHDGKCSIEDYVNNLVPIDEYSDIYGDLEVLFAQFLPYIEEVFSHAVDVLPEIRTSEHQPTVTAGSPNEGRFNHRPLQHISLRNRQLQVVTRICEYVLEPGGHYDSHWIIKGMSHEEIVLTCMYVLDRDEGLEGGDLFLKRAFLQREASFIVSNVGNPRPIIVEWMVAEGMKPLGKVETRKGRLIVFPNSHVSRLGRIVNTSSSTARMRILCFYLVNPLKRIISTREVAPQQACCNGTMSVDEAILHKRKLMKIRNSSKQDWNVYRINLPES